MIRNPAKGRSIKTRSKKFEDYTDQILQFKSQKTKSNKIKTNYDDFSPSNFKSIENKTVRTSTKKP